MLRVSLCHPAERVALGQLHMSVLQLTVELVHCALLLGLALREVLQTDKQGSVLVIVTLIAGIPQLAIVFGSDAGAAQPHQRACFWVVRRLLLSGRGSPDCRKIRPQPPGRVTLGP